MPSAFSLFDVVEESSAETPNLIYSSPGVDVSEELKAVAKQLIGLENFSEIPLGRGQHEYAIEQIKRVSAVGGWLCIKNLHLSLHWIPQIEIAMTSVTPHKNFRLWLTTERRENLPSTLLLSSLKIAYETPPGLKKNLLQTYSSWGPEYIARSGQNNFLRAQCLFGLAWFHALTEERRSYIPLGWTKFYEFNYSDLKAGSDLIERMISGSSIQWEFIHGVMANAIYGGRVDNDFDFRVLWTYLREVFSDSVTPGKSSGRQQIAPGLTLPASRDLRDYLKLINKLEDSDRPDYFGFPANIDSNSQRAADLIVTNKLGILSRSFSMSDKFELEKWHKELSPVLNLWKKLNSSVNLTRQHVPDRRLSAVTEDRTKLAHNEDPVTSFLELEYKSALRLVHAVHTDLTMISRVLRGSMVVTDDVERLVVCLLHDRTPASWLDLWPGPERPTTYLRSLVARTRACDQWRRRSASGSLLSGSEKPLDLADLFRPSAFLNALRLLTCRQAAVPVDQLRLMSMWLVQSDVKASLIPPNHPQVRVSDMLLEGCRFEAGHLEMLNTDSPSVNSVPVCCLAWVLQPSVSSTEKSITIPLYQNQRRDKLITRLEVPCGRHEDSVWIKAGVTLYLRE